MAVRPIHLFGSDVLRRKAAPVEDLDNSTVKLIYDLVETMHKASGIGLAATQVGEMKQVLVIDLNAVEEASRDEAEDSPQPSQSSEPKTLVMINPEVKEGSGSWTMEEGCLSIPEVRADVERSESILVRFRDANYREIEMSASDLLARVMLHEIDHLQGILFIDRLSSAKRALLKGALRKIKKGEAETAYPVLSTPARAVKSAHHRSGRVEV